MDAAQFQQFLDAVRAQAPAAGAAAAARERTVKPELFSSGDGPTWLTWRRNYTHIVALNGWGDAAHLERAKRVARVSITGKADQVVADIQPGDAGQTLEQFLDLLEARFVPAAQAQFAKVAFDNCVQNPAESLLEYHSRTRALYIRANPGEAHNVENSQPLIRKYVLGIIDPVVKEFVLEREPATFAAALNHAQNKAAVRSVCTGSVTAGNKITALYQQGGISAVYDGTSTPSTAAATQNLRHPEGSFPVSSFVRKDAQCWECGSYEHMKRDCPRLQHRGRYGGGGRGRSAQRGRGRGRGGRGGASSRPSSRGRRVRFNIGNIDGPTEGQTGQDDGYIDSISSLAEDVRNGLSLE